MLSFFRRVTTSKIGAWVMAAIMVAILAGFAAADLSNFGTGKIGLGGMAVTTLAQGSDQEVSEREMAEAMQRRLWEVRRQNPEGEYAIHDGVFESLLNLFIDQRLMIV